MAEEEVTLSSPNPLPSDPKRKIDDLQSQSSADVTHDGSSDVTLGNDSPSSKKPKLDDAKSDALAHENGVNDQKEGEEAKDDVNELNVNLQQGEADSLPSPSEECAKKEQGEGDARDSPSEQAAGITSNEEPAMDSHKTVNVPETSVQDSETEKTENVSKEEGDKAYQENVEPASEDQTTSHKMEIPNDKVGVLIGKGGDTIRYLQYNSGAKIQITKDIDAIPQSATRPVEIVGTLSSIQKAEKLIAAVIAEADAGGSPALVARGGVTSTGTIGPGDQLEIQVPNDKVGLIIGKGGETIKNLQTKSGARIQLIPQHLPEGDGSKERTVRITGDRRKIETAREMIMDVMNQTVRPSHHSSGFYQQQQYRPRGPSGPGHWGGRGPPPSRSMPYDYQQRGPYPSQNSQYPGSHGSYPPQQIGPRSGYGSSWEQRPPSMQRSLPHGGGYDYYGGQGGNEPHRPALPQSSALISGHAAGPSPSLSQANYFGHQAPYSQAAHPQQQGYGHGYNESKLHANAQQYGHGNSQPVYPQPSNQPGYGAPHQYGKQPSYGVPTQGSGPQPQAYAAPPRPTHPGDASYQPPVQSAHSYGSNAMQQQQQQYPYTSSTPMQQTYPQYGSVPATDGYSQAQSTSTGYPQGAQAVQTYGQPAGYAYPSGTYGSYASSQAGYGEQAATGYQGPSDGNNGQLGYAPQGSQYAQPATQPGYDPSVQQAGGYAAAPASAPVG